MVAKETQKTQETKSSVEILAKSIKNDFFEKNDTVSCTLYVKGIIPNQCQIDFYETNATIFFKTSDPNFLKCYNTEDSNTLFQINAHFFDHIEPNKCSFKINKYNLELVLIKKTNLKWSNALKSSDETPTSNNTDYLKPLIKDKDESRVNQTHHVDNNQTKNAKLTVTKSQESSSPSSSPSPPPSPSLKSLSIDKVIVPAKNLACENPNYGLTGLVNLGNTCYMNAALQFLINVTDLRDYFLETTQLFQKEINTDNALGLNGKMAVGFSILMKQLWTSNSKYITPTKLRDLICYKFSNFRGYEQHDTQEFMCSFLSVLHEDLNRVLKKPYYESSLECDNDSMANTQKVAKESWQRFLSRENSVIVDNFYGQFKSKLTCPECHFISNTFEPFNNLLVPLAKPKINFNFIVMFHVLKHQDPIKLNLYLNETSTIQELFELVCLKFTDLKPNCLKAFNVTFSNEVDPYNENDNFYTFIPDWKFVSSSSTILDNIKSNKLLIINEIISNQEAKEDILEMKIEQVIKIPMKNVVPLDQCSFCNEKAVECDEEKKLPRCTKCYRSAYCNSECQRKDWNKHSTTLCCKPLDSIGIPFLITLKKSQIDSVERLKSLITDTSICFLEISKQNIDLKKRIEFVVTQEGKSEKIVALDEILTLENPENNTRSIKIQLKWNNSDSIRVKTSLNKLKIFDDPLVNQNQTSVHLNDCLKLFTQAEKLTSENPWYCSKCKKHQEATKQMNIWQLPKYLIITLKRFQATKASDSLSNMNSEDPTYKYLMMNSRLSSFLQNRVVYNKLNTNVTFPLKNLDMSKYVINPNIEENSHIYDLCAVINHLGQSISLGHYTAFARTHAKNDTEKDELGWRLFDDQHVMHVQNLNQIVSKDAYVLMYRLRSNKNRESFTEKVDAVEMKNENENLNNDPEENSSEAASEDFYDIDTDESEEIKDDDGDDEEEEDDEPEASNKNTINARNSFRYTKISNQSQKSNNAQASQNLMYTNLNDLD